MADDDTSAPSPSYGMDDYAHAIGSIESGNNYGSVGPATNGGDRAYGRYQVMGSNVGDWTAQHYGQRLTPQQFLDNPDAQDAVFRGQFGSYVSKYGNPNDAASMWFSGRPLASAGNASDGYNTTPQYVSKFQRALGAAPAPNQSGGASGTLPVQSPPAPVASATASNPTGLLDMAPATNWSRVASQLGQGPGMLNSQPIQPAAAQVMQRAMQLPNGTPTAQAMRQALLSRILQR